VGWKAPDDTASGIHLRDRQSSIRFVLCEHQHAALENLNDLAGLGTHGVDRRQEALPALDGAHSVLTNLL
jgi:hypothetical protein